MVKNSVITGTGSYIPDEVRTNQHFINTTFYTEKGELIDEPGEKVISKFTKLKNPLNCFLANCNLTFGDLESLEYHKTKESENISKVLVWFIFDLLFGVIVIWTELFKHFRSSGTFH